MLDANGRPLIIRTANGAFAAAYTYDAKNALGALRLFAQTEGMLQERDPRPRRDEDCEEEALHRRLLDKLAEIAAKQVTEKDEQK